MIDDREPSLGALLLGFFIHYGCVGAKSHAIFSQVISFSPDRLFYERKVQDDALYSTMDDAAIEVLGGDQSSRVGSKQWWRFAIEDPVEKERDLGSVITKVEGQVRILDEFARAIILFKDYFFNPSLGATSDLNSAVSECKRDEECKTEIILFNQLFEIYEEKSSNKEPCKLCSSTKHSIEHCPQCVFCGKKGHSSTQCRQQICYKCFGSHVKKECPQGLLTSAKVVSDPNSDIDIKIDVLDVTLDSAVNWEGHTDVVSTRRLSTYESYIENPEEYINQTTFIDTVLSWRLRNVNDSNLLLKDIKKIPSEFQNSKEWYSCFYPFVLEEARYQLSLAIDKTSRDMDRIHEMQRYKFVVSNTPSPRSFDHQTITVDIEVDRDALTENDFQILNDSVSSFVLIVRLKSKSKSIKLKDFVRDQEPILAHISSKFDILNEKSTKFRMQICSEFSGLLSLRDNSEHMELFLLSVGSTTSSRICDALGRRDKPTFIHDILVGKVHVTECDEDQIGANVKYDHFTTDLNDSQRDAINQIMSVGKSGIAPIQIIKGPPGMRREGG